MDTVGPGFGKWQGGVGVTAENVRACLHNAREAKEKLQEAHAIALAKPGTVEGIAARNRATRFSCELLHWTQAASDWQRELDRLNREAAAVAAKVEQERARQAEIQRRTALALSARPPAPVVEHHGADDDGDAVEPEERESAWADIGGTVAR
jgi:uncharacterized protein YukE